MDFVILVGISAIVITIWITTGIAEDSIGSRTVETGWKRNLNTNNNVSKRKRISNRKYALSKAKSFLKVYKDPMGEHSLANENCKVNLIIEKNGNKKIICISKHLVNGNKRRIMTAEINPPFADFYTYPADYVIDNMWDILCINFTYTTMYENIVEASENMRLKVEESTITATPQNKDTQKIYDSVSNTQIRSNNLLNINSATEAELISLPGVNIIIAKKAIAYIERTGGFKSVDEFLQKMKIKENFAEQIKNITCTTLDNPKNNNAENSQNQSAEESNTPHSQNERIIDL